MQQGIHHSSSRTCNLPQEHISYQAEQKIRYLIKPLEQIGGIQYFCYGVNYPDTSGYTLHTNSKFYESWFGHEGTLRGFYLKNGFHLYDHLLPKEVLKEANAQNIGNFITFIEHKNDKTIIYEFGTTPDNKDILEFYKNNLDLLKRFGKYFSQTLAPDIIALAETQRIIPPSCMLQGKNQNDMQSCFNVLDIPEFPCDILTTIEKNYLKKLLQGYSNVEIGNEVNLSPKTISSHILSLKKKLGCKTNRELFIKMLSEGALHFHFNNPLFSNISEVFLDDYSIYSFLNDLYSPISKLSKRELSCYQLVLNGFTLNEIGNELGISLQTVADYVSRLKHKLGCKTKRDLFLQAIENGFLDISSFIS